MSECARIFVSLGLILLASCRIGVNGPAEELVSHFQFEPEAFDSFVGASRARYHLSRPSHVSLAIERLTDEGTRVPVKTLFENLFEASGSHAHTWLGETDAGTFALSGSYVGILSTGRERFEAVVRIYHR